jgi:hypothetical protein
MTPPHTIVSQIQAHATTGDPSPLGILLHSLSNKLLPIVVFSELALLRCEDTQLKPQLEKIHGAAEQACDLLVEIRTLQGKLEA